MLQQTRAKGGGRETPSLPGVNEGFSLYPPRAKTSSLNSTQTLLLSLGQKHKPTCKQQEGAKKAEAREAKQTVPSHTGRPHTRHTHAALRRWGCERQTGMQEKTRQIQMISQLCFHIREKEHPPRGSADDRRRLRLLPGPDSVQRERVSQSGCSRLVVGRLREHDRWAGGGFLSFLGLLPLSCPVKGAVRAPSAAFGVPPSQWE